MSAQEGDLKKNQTLSRNNKFMHNGNMEILTFKSFCIVHTRSVCNNIYRHLKAQDLLLSPLQLQHSLSHWVKLEFAILIQ